MALPTFSIDNSLGEEKNYLQILEDRVIILKPRGPAHTKLQLIKKEMQIQGINVEKFLSFDVALRKIDYIYYSFPQIAPHGYILFHIKYTEFKVPNLWNSTKMSNCFTVYRQNVDDVERIIQYIKNSYPNITIETT